MRFGHEAIFPRHRHWQETRRSLPVTPRLDRDAIVARLAAYDFAGTRALDAVVDDVADLLERGTVHSTHPRYFGLFVPSVSRAGIAGDALAALYNPQVGAWWHGPAACELERHTLDFFRRRLGHTAPEGSAHFTTGGSEANLTAVLSALAHAFPRYLADGLGALPRPPLFYVSAEAHDSFVKVARVTGLGERALRRVPSDGRQRLDVGELAELITRDRQAGGAPFLVVATVGTTATGAIDPLPELLALCHAERLWLHADAAWGGLAVLSDRLRPHVTGLGEVDSITWDAHKTLPVPMGAGMFFTRARAVSAAHFAVRPGYVPATTPGTDDGYQQTLQWSRRCIGLKVFLTLAELGEAGVAALIDHQAAMADLLRDELRAAGWQITNDTPLPLVCFSRAGADPDAVARAVVAEGRAWLSTVRLPSGAQWLRACMTSHETQAEDVRELVAALGRAVA
jgi:glutamate/tyrosine decarboxylase-like PLP-dependent enzyme